VTAAAYDDPFAPAFSSVTRDSAYSADDRVDRYNRYRLPHLESGRVVPYTRVTTFAKVLADTFKLSLWNQRLAVKGLTLRPDLFDAVMKCSLDDKDDLNYLVEQAKEAAGSKVKASLGTAIHKITEDIDNGILSIKNVSQEHLPDIKAYIAERNRRDIVTVPGMIERIVVNPVTNTAGTIDRIDQLPDGSLIIGDVKTGNIDYGELEMAMQVAIYAHSTHMWDKDRKRYVPMPAVRRDIAGIWHIPAGTGKCTLKEVDIEFGWLAALEAIRVKNMRAKKSIIKPWKENNV
jgi:hypothetical protein